MYSFLKSEWRDRYLQTDYECNELIDLVPKKFNCCFRQINVAGFNEDIPRCVEEYRIFELISEIGDCIDDVSALEVGEMDSMFIVFKRV